MALVYMPSAKRNIGQIVRVIITKSGKSYPNAAALAALATWNDVDCRVVDGTQAPNVAWETEGSKVVISDHNSDGTIDAGWDGVTFGENATFTGGSWVKASDTAHGYLKATGVANQAVITTKLGSSEITVPELNTFGLDTNETAYGAGEVISENSAQFSAQMIGVYATGLIKQLRKWNEEDDLSAFLISGTQSAPKIHYQDVNGTIQPIPISSLFFGSAGGAGLDVVTSNGVQFTMSAGWDEDIKVVDAAFTINQLVQNLTLS